ncbi:restriction endonuclease subunit S [Yersinia sp. 2544 StPb PI]|uniref:restriction endonuclease subunit S n=1 Tax=Yersinia TaxID=629 RepID=UPI001F535C9C|nr:restriction endonuclease subunit S [Yersinia intermedia]UNK22957.1 restriction endonuclease subunit S [Yersinia intermedia]
MVPKLRFSFKSALLPYKLGTLTQWSSGGTPSKDNKSYWDGDISWFTAASMKSNELSVSPTKISNSGLVNGSRLANKDDILLLVRGSMLFNKIPVGILLNEAAFNQDVKAIKSLKNFNHTFALQWFLAKEPLLLSMVTGTGIGAGKLDTKELQSLDVYLPGNEEQIKITDFLSSVDEKITLLNKQHQLLCQYNKGMMQKIFSQELRLEGFKERWVSKYLGDVASKIGSGSTPRGGSEVYQSTGVPFIRSQNVHNGQLNLKDLAFISSEVDEKMKGSRVKSGDVLLNITGASIGRSCVVPEYFKHGNVNQHVCIIRLPNDHPKFLQAFISSEQGQKLIDNTQSGSGREGLNFENIRNFKIYFPSIEEQTKIADFLSAIDDKITAKKVQLDKLKTWKQGLLQQMFV